MFVVFASTIFSLTIFHLLDFTGFVILQTKWEKSSKKFVYKVYRENFKTKAHKFLKRIGLCNTPPPLSLDNIQAQAEKCQKLKHKQEKIYWRMLDLANTVFPPPLFEQYLNRKWFFSGMPFLRKGLILSSYLDICLCHCLHSSEEVQVIQSFSIRIGKQSRWQLG